MMIFGQKGRITKTELLFQAIKREQLIFTEKVSDKMLLECYSDQNEWQHYPLPSEGS